MNVLRTLRDTGVFFVKIILFMEEVFQPGWSLSIIVSAACSSISIRKVLYSRRDSCTRVNSYSRTLPLLPEHCLFRWNPYNIEKLSTVSLGKCKSEGHQSHPRTRELQDMLT